MKEYRGIVRIECTRKAGCPRKLKQNVQAGCLDCPEAVTRIVDLVDKVMFEYRAPEAKPGRRSTKKSEE
jgi:hypothetical protein